MAGQVCIYRVRARPGILVLFDEVGEGLVHERLKLAAFALGKRSHRRQDFGINLGRNISRSHAPDALVTDHNKAIHETKPKYHELGRRFARVSCFGGSYLYRWLVSPMNGKILWRISCTNFVDNSSTRQNFGFRIANFEKAILTKVKECWVWLALDRNLNWGSFADGMLTHRSNGPLKRLLRRIPINEQ